MQVLPHHRAVSLTGFFSTGIIIASALMMPLALAGNKVSPGDSRILLAGAWQSQEDALVTPYPGSEIRFRLGGAARMHLYAPRSNAISLRVLSGTGMVVRSGIWNEAHLDLESPFDGEDWRVQFVASEREGFYTNHKAILRFHGLALINGARLYEPPRAENPPKFIFLGDSITAGVVIHGREGYWHENSDATQTFAYHAATELRVNYAIRGFPGAQMDELINVYPWFSEGVPLDTFVHPDWVIINAGANDRKLDASQYRNKLGQLVELVRELHPDTRILLLNFFRMTPSRWSDLLYVARQYPGGTVSCFDARPYLVDYTDRHVHPGPESHRRLGEALADFFRASRLDLGPVRGEMKTP